MPLKTRKVSDSYFRLVKEFPLRRIGSASEHRRALAVLSRFAGRQPVDEGVTDYLGVLSDLIADYERRAGHAIDTSDVTAADLVRHLMAEQDLTITGLARDIGVSQSNLSEMLSGKRGWSKTAISGLSDRFSLNPMRFLARAARQGVLEQPRRAGDRRVKKQKTPRHAGLSAVMGAAGFEPAKA